MIHQNINKNKSWIFISDSFGDRYWRKWHTPLFTQWTSQVFEKPLEINKFAFKPSLYIGKTYSVCARRSDVSQPPSLRWRTASFIILMSFVVHRMGCIPISHFSWCWRSRSVWAVLRKYYHSNPFCALSAGLRWQRVSSVFYQLTWFFQDRSVWCISLRLSDRLKVTQNKLNFIKSSPQWGLNLQFPDHRLLLCQLS